MPGRKYGIIRSVRKRIPYVNEEVSGRDFKYYIFDWDDNILHMPTKIRMEHLDDDGTWRPEFKGPSMYCVKGESEKTLHGSERGH